MQRHGWAVRNCQNVLIWAGIKSDFIVACMWLCFENEIENSADNTLIFYLLLNSAYTASRLGHCMIGKVPALLL